jgi:hypothetical protein
MAKIVYWMVFQVLVGLWLFVSPFVLGYAQDAVGRTMTANSMIFGSTVALLGLGISLFNEKFCSEIEPHSDKRT